MIQLDTKQEEAVFTESTRALVLAGAGSGKTRVLIERIAHLIEDKKVSPAEILALTFTRKASSEMRSRLEARIGGAANRVSIGTIHATALKLLHRFGDLIGMKARNITVYGEFEEQYLLREVAIDLGIYNGKSWKVKKRDVDAMLNTYYSRGEEPTEDNPAYKLFRDLLDRCRENNALTYGMILTSMMRLVPEIKQYLQWKYILVDEAQDTDPLQWWIIEEFPRLLGASIFAVGDIDQSIYRFRGAVPEYLVKTQHTFDIYRLENNYRSLPEIVEAANRLIEHNSERLPKTMRATRNLDVSSFDIDTEVVQTLTGCDSHELANVVSAWKYWGHGSIAVLSRIHVLLEKLSEELTILNIPHVKIGRKTELTNSEEFRRFHAFLKLIVNPYDNFAFMLVREKIGLSREQYNTVRLASTQMSLSHYQAWVKTSFTIPEFMQHDWNGGDYPLFTVIAHLQDSFVIAEDIADFITAWIEQNPKGTVAEYLDWLATWDVQDEIADEENEDKVTLCTAHAAKGLEFPVVILAGCNEGIMPSKRAVSAGDIEEERRLMYVAATRAEDRLIITVRPETEESPRSRFIGEM